MSKAPDHHGIPLVALSGSAFARLQFIGVGVIVLLGLGNYVLPVIFPMVHENDVLNVGVEKSLPTWFAVANLFLGALLAAAVASDVRQRGERLFWQWVLLAALVALLSLDESAALHERLVGHGAELMPGMPQLASHGWVFFGGLFALAAGLFFLPLLLGVQRLLAVRMMVAGAVFIGGAIGMEVVGALADYYGWLERDNLLYKLRRIGEEGGELLGVALFNRALYWELVRQRWGFAPTP